VVGEELPFNPSRVLDCSEYPCLCRFVTAVDLVHQLDARTHNSKEGFSISHWKRSWEVLEEDCRQDDEGEFDQLDGATDNGSDCWEEHSSKKRKGNTRDAGADDEGPVYQSKECQRGVKPCKGKQVRNCHLKHAQAELAERLMGGGGEAKHQPEERADDNTGFFCSTRMYITH
jgi:hypothetical protein